MSGPELPPLGPSSSGLDLVLPPGLGSIDQGCGDPLISGEGRWVRPLPPPLGGDGPHASDRALGSRPGIACCLKVPDLLELVPEAWVLVKQSVDGVKGLDLRRLNGVRTVSLAT